MPRNPNKTRCTFPGCHNWAMRREDRCHAHRYAAEPNPPDGDDPLGLLPPVEGHVDPGDASWSSGPDLVDLDAHIVELNESLRGLAAHVRRLDAQLEHDPALLPGYIRLLTLQGRLTSRLSRLLRERQQIRQAEDQDLLHQAMDIALDQAGEILGVQL